MNTLGPKMSEAQRVAIEMMTSHIEQELVKEEPNMKSKISIAAVQALQRNHLDLKLSNEEKGDKLSLDMIESIAQKGRAFLDTLDT
ncbi:MAG: hypothetical protein AAB544_04465 [Patescibacteria group bacterium]